MGRRQYSLWREGNRRVSCPAGGGSSGGSVVNQEQRVFNGLGQMTTEWQTHWGAVNTLTTPKVQYAFSEPSAH